MLIFCFSTYFQQIYFSESPFFLCDFLTHVYLCNYTFIAIVFQISKYDVLKVEIKHGYGQMIFYHYMSNVMYHQGRIYA